MQSKEVLLNYVKGRHTSGQMLNLVKYFLGKKKEVVNWDPIYVSVFPTYKCNFSCDMCLTHSNKFSNPNGQKPGSDLDFEQFKKILDYYKNSIVVNLIGNGEPLLNKDLFSMIEYASKVKKMYVFTSSNGIMLGEHIQKIVDSSLRGFQISLNGHNPNEFNRMTGMPSKSFNVICENVAELVKQRNLRKSEVEILVSIVLDKENYADIKDMANFASELGADKILFFQFLPFSATGFTGSERCLFSHDANIVKAFSQVESLPSKVRKKVLLPPLLNETMDSNRCCTVPFYNIMIDGGNNVGFCCMSSNFINNGKYYEKDSWNNDYFRNVRNMFMKPDVPVWESCKWCYHNTGRTRLLSNPNPVSHVTRKVFSKLLKKS